MHEILEAVRAAEDVKSPTSYAVLALLTGATVRVLKTKTVGDLLDAVPWKAVKRIPKEWLPYLAILIAFIAAFLDAKVTAGLGWRESFYTAFLGAVLGGGAAIGGHVVLAKPLSNLATKTEEPPAPPPAQGDPP